MLKVKYFLRRFNCLNLVSSILLFQLLNTCYSICWITSQYKACSYLHILIASALLSHISNTCYSDCFIISQYSWSLFYPEIISMMLLKNVNDNLILLLKIIIVEEISSFQWYLKEIIVVFQKMFCVMGTSKRHQISVDVVQY